MKKEKGSIAVFVLVALLFMTAFLIILFASNVNKSKMVKEQFDIINGIYAYTNGEEGAYDKAYSDLRNKNKQTMTASSENSDTLELTKTFNENISNYRIYGNSVQNGTPTPDNPVEVQSVGERTKNLCPQSFTSGYPVSSGWASADGYTTSDFIEITSGKTYTGSIYDNEYQNINRLVYVTYDENKNFLAQYTTSSITPSENEKYIRVRSYGTQSELINSGKFYFQLEEGTQATEYEPYGKYKIPLKVTGSNVARINDGELGNIYMAIYGIPVKKGQEITYIVNYINNSSNPNHNLAPRLYSDESLSTLIESYDTITSGSDIIKTITMTSDGYFTFSFGYGYKTIEFNKLFVGIGKFNIEDYQPYQEQTFNIILDEPLRKVGDYSDYIDFKTQKIVRMVGSYTFTGNETFSVSGHTSNTSFCVYTPNIIPEPKLSYKYGFMNRGNVGVYSQINVYNNGFFYNNNINHFLRIENTAIPNWDNSLTNSEKITLFKEYLKTTDVNIIYLLATPTEETITLPQLKSYEDYTKIEVLTDVAPSKIEAEYVGYTLE